MVVSGAATWQREESQSCQFNFIIIDLLKTFNFNKDVCLWVCTYMYICVSLRTECYTGAREFLAACCRADMNGPQSVPFDSDPRFAQPNDCFPLPMEISIPPFSLPRVADPPRNSISRTTPDVFIAHSLQLHCS